MKGRIKTWNDERGFGFIAPQGGGADVFLHVSALACDGRPELNQMVSYTLSQDKQGRPRAQRVRLPGAGVSAGIRLGGVSAALLAAGFFLLVVAASVALGPLPRGVLFLYLVLSLVAAFIYAMDKSAAKHGGRRTPENTLHLLALAGGWPGALVAQQVLRHKTRKQPFRAIFLGTVVVNICAFLWLFTPAGMNAFQTLLLRI